jgi:hypothetical protein
MSKEFGVVRGSWSDYEAVGDLYELVRELANEVKELRKEVRTGFARLNKGIDYGWKGRREGD